MNSYIPATQFSFTFAEDRYLPRSYLRAVWFLFSETVIVESVLKGFQYLWVIFFDLLVNGKGAYEMTYSSSSSGV